MDKMLRTLFVNTIKRELGNGGEKYCQYTGVNYIFDWCMAFTSYAMREIAGLGMNFPLHTSCTKFLNSPFGVNRRNKDFKTAEVGDIIEFELDGVDYDMEHVGIVIEVGEDFVVLIEGNTDGENCRETTVNTFKYSKNNPKFGWIFDMSDFFTDESSRLENLKETELESEKVFEKLEYLSNSLNDVINDLNLIQKLHDEVNKEIHKII